MTLTFALLPHLFQLSFNTLFSFQYPTRIILLLPHRFFAFPILVDEILIHFIAQVQKSIKNIWFEKTIKAKKIEVIEKKCVCLVKIGQTTKTKFEKYMV